MVSNNYDFRSFQLHRADHSFKASGEVHHSILRKATFRSPDEVGKIHRMYEYHLQNDTVAVVAIATRCHLPPAHDSDNEIPIIGVGAAGFFRLVS